MSASSTPPSRSADVDAALARLPLALSTTWASLEGCGARLRVEPDCLVVDSPHLPGHLWASALQVLDPARVDEAERWRQTALLALPGRARPAFGLAARPSADVWRAVPCPPLGDLPLVWRPQHWVALAAERLEPMAPLPPGWRIEMMNDDARWADWAAQPSPAGPEFVATWASLKRERQLAGRAAFLAGIVDDQLVASGGITLVEVGGRLLARYEDVQTCEEFRRRGLASHLLAAAHRWALAEGARTSVLVADADGPAIGLYRRLGFRTVDEAWMVLPGRAAAGATAG